MLAKKEQTKKIGKSSCICRSCPSYVDCKEEVAFCQHGRSKCIKEGKGCLCGGCPVQKQYNQKHYFYCLRGSEKQQEK